jgi:hypothetical protein
MSAIVHAAQTVAATPLPSPQVVKETFTQVVPANTPAVVIQAAQIAAMFVSALLLSVAHRVAEWLTAKEEGWGSAINALVATVYSAGVGLLGAASMHQLGTDTTQLVTLALSTSVAFAGSFWTYAVRKGINALTSLGASAPEIDPDPGKTPDSAPETAAEGQG